MGIQQLGVRKKLLDGIQAVHRKEWQRSSLPAIQYNRQLRSVYRLCTERNGSGPVYRLYSTTDSLGQYTGCAQKGMAAVQFTGYTVQQTA